MLRRIKVIILTIIFLILCINVSYSEEIDNKTTKTMILMYHMISKNAEHINTYCISPEDFEKDIKYLKKNNYVFAFPDEIEQVKNENPGKNIAVLTFDDGYSSDYNLVLPILERYDAKATFFIIGSMIGKPYYMNATQIRLLSESECAKIGNHSHSIHKKTLNEIINMFSDVTKTNDVVYDFNYNKSILENLTGKKIDILSYPNSVYNFYVDSVLKYNGVCNITFSTEEKSSNFKEENIVIGRYNRSNLRSVEDIEKLLN